MAQKLALFVVEDIEGVSEYCKIPKSFSSSSAPHVTCDPSDEVLASAAVGWTGRDIFFSANSSG